MKNIMCLNIKKALKKSAVLDEYKKNILITLSVHINQTTKLIIKDFINLIIKKIVENKYRAITTLMNKTYN